MEEGEIESPEICVAAASPYSDIPLILTMSRGYCLSIAYLESGILLFDSDFKKNDKTTVLFMCAA